MPCTWALAAARSASAAVDGGLLDRELDLVGFLVELDQDAPFHAHVVINQHPAHLARQPAAPRTSRAR